MLGFLSWTSTQEHPSCIWDLILQNGASCVQHWMYCLVSCWYHCALFPTFDINHVNVQCLAPSPSLSRLHSMFLGARLFESLMVSFPVNAQCNLVQFCPQGHFMAAIPAVCWRADLQLWEPTCCCERVPVPPWAMFQRVQVACSSSDTAIVFMVCFFPRLCSSDIKYTARWSNETVFSSILISPKMITDHMPDVVLKALNSLSQEHGSCLSCQTRDYNPSAV